MAITAQTSEITKTMRGHPQARVAVTATELSGTAPKADGQRVKTTSSLLVVVALCSLVYGWCVPGAMAGEQPLPAHVAETREMILAAVRAASLEDLAAVIDASAVKPDFGLASGDNPIAGLKALSADGRGLEILAALRDVLDVAPATLPLGKDLENNLVYVWPYLAEKPLDTLSSADEIELYRLMPAAKVAEMREKKRWIWWRLAIGADGSLLLFKKMP
ncbi:MAG: hypothetical protein ABL893_04810 [Hyphomicrobium sp.]